jgi:hypothetical protein
MEVMHLTAVTDADTVSTTIQNPLFAMAVPGTDTASITVAINVGISGKVLTINSSDLSNEIVDLLIFGF